MVRKVCNLEGDTEKKLLKAFSKFRKTDWHEKRIMGYKPSEIKVLFALQSAINDVKTDMKVFEISKLLEVTSPTVTQIINELEKTGVVIRTIDPTDRRAVKIKLSEKGITVTAEIKKVFAKSFSGLVEYLGEEESNQLADLLFKVYQYFDQLNP
ncbi:MarR family transcriptional regulator [Bacillus sp. EB600]|uniref:MarR family winged helix-turn-helix transcriptional regulator n=1 Tax=Bacillus sp. EB600 TaxID=2806345 RepID=UPI0021093AC8|nr:MarR family transcriptional regulator [Bacillus sp. EB600]